jgi:hypothetical protein
VEVVVRTLIFVWLIENYQAERYCGLNSRVRRRAGGPFDVELTRISVADG